MATEIVEFAPEHLGVAQRFSEQTWQRPRSAAFYAWRYEQAPESRTYLALRDGECLAMCSAFRRPYRLDGEIVPFFETFDWYTIPGLRNVGLGVRLIQRFMAEKEPLILVGGSEDARTFLARLAWQHVGDTRRWALRLRSGVATAIRRRTRMPERGARMIARAAQFARRPRSHGAMRGARAIAVGNPGPELDAFYRGPVAYGTLALWTEKRLRWLLHGFAGLGHFVPLYFAIGEQLVGFALLRIYGTRTGRSVELVDLLCPSADGDLYDWFVSEITHLADGFDAEVLGTTTTCPMVERALGRNRFRMVGALPIHVWARERTGLPGPLLIGSNTRDTALNPYPTHWWGDPPRA